MSQKGRGDHKADYCHKKVVTIMRLISQKRGNEANYSLEDRTGHMTDKCQEGRRGHGTD